MEYIVPGDIKQTKLEIKRSEFIVNIFRVSNEEDVMIHLNDIKRIHYRANHNCYAYIIGPGRIKRKYSDDGEPSGTAGKPILNVLESSGFTDILCIVTRYFGGIKLGASGLYKAYNDAASFGISNTSQILIKEMALVEIKCDYNFYQKMYLFILKNDFIIKDTVFEKDVTILFYIPVDDIKVLNAQIIEMSNGQYILTLLDRVFKEIVR